MIRLCVLVASCCSLAVASLTNCSNPESPRTCTCQTHPWGGPEIRMTCVELTDPGQLLRALRMNANVVSLHLVNCHLPYLPLYLAPHRMAELHISNGSLDYLSPPMSDMSALEGLTNLTTIVVKGLADLSNWDWSKLQPLKHLQLIHVQDSRLPELPSSLSSLGEKYGWKLNVTNSHLLHISASALASKSLSSFSSWGNPLRSLRRDITASSQSIRELQFVGTKVTALDASFFSDLRNLNTVVVDANFLSVMTGRFNYNLHAISIVGPPPTCTCKYSYLLVNGLRWKETCILTTSTQSTSFILAEFLQVAC